MKIALVNDVSGFGNCSLTAGAAVLAAMGHEPHPLVTAVLSNQTAYPSYAMRDVSDTVGGFLNKWAETGEKIDMICAGFSPSARTPAEIVAMKKHYGATLVLDPVLGDDGKFYDCFGPEHLAAYRQAAREADFITPNLTEARLLAASAPANVSRDFAEAFALAEKIGARNTIITGVTAGDAIFNVCLFSKKRFVSENRRRGGAYSGTGDLFAAAFTGYLANGETPENAVKKAADFIEICVADAEKTGLGRQHGVAYYKFLDRL